MLQAASGTMYNRWGALGYKYGMYLGMEEWIWTTLSIVLAWHVTHPWTLQSDVFFFKLKTTVCIRIL